MKHRPKSYKYFATFLRNFILYVLSLTFFSNCQYLSATRDIATSEESVFPDAGLTNPKLRFHTGGIVNNAPEISKDLPNILGEASAWYLTQWRRPTFISPLKTKVDPEVDTLLGRAQYYFPSADNKTHLKIYKSNANKYTFELYSTGGVLDTAGGTNIFLSAESNKPEISLEKQVDYAVDIKFSKAKIKYNFLSNSKNSGAVMSQLFTGFILKYTDPKDSANRPTTVFMQIYHNNTSYPNQSYRGCYRHNNSMEIVYGNVLADDKKIDFVSTITAPQKLNFVINQYLCDMISKGFDCNDNGHRFKFDFPPEAKDFKNWKIGSMYIGLETQDTDLRNIPEAERLNQKPQGSVEAAVQISNLRVTKSNTVDFQYANDCRR